MHTEHENAPQVDERDRAAMATPRKLPDNDVLLSLRRQKWTYKRIAETYGVTESAVYLRLKQARAVQPKPAGFTDLIPWRVRKEHDFAYPLQMLRLLAREDRGLPNPADRKRMLDAWLQDIREADVVVCYDPNMGPNPASRVGGFYYSRRRPEDGKSLIRVDPGAELRAT